LKGQLIFASFFIDKLKFYKIMEKLITGIHHITAMASSAQDNLDFYAGVLGLRFIKRTVNFDDPSVYHLYYGDELGSPGTVLTFFPYHGMPRGRKGHGMVNTISFSASIDAFSFWEKRLKKYNIEHTPPYERFNTETVIDFEDTDGTSLELVFSSNDDTRMGYAQGNIPEEYAIKGFYGAEIWDAGHHSTSALLTSLMDHVLVAEQGNRHRFAATNKPGHYIDIVDQTGRDRGQGGSGTVHHIAFSTPDKSTQVEIQQKIANARFNITPVIDRDYFKSVYFRETSGVLFEVATNGPGFAIDEDPALLGQSLKLPKMHEPRRAAIESGLGPLSLNNEKFL